MLPTDLKDFHAERDPFQKLDPEVALICLIVGTVIGYVLGAFGRVAS